MALVPIKSRLGALLGCLASTFLRFTHNGSKARLFFAQLAEIAGDFYVKQLPILRTLNVA